MFPFCFSKEHVHIQLSGLLKVILLNVYCGRVIVRGLICCFHSFLPLWTKLEHISKTESFPKLAVGTYALVKYTERLELEI